MAKIITVIGDIASGKSAFSPRLADSLNATYIPADELYLINPFFQAAVRDRARWSLASDLWFLKERVKLLRMINQDPKEFVVVDSGLLMSLAYTAMRESLGQFTTDEWQLYLEYYHSLTADSPTSDVVIYLSAPPELTMERMRLRGREYELKNFTIDYIAGVHWGLEYVVTDLKEKRIPVIQQNISSTEAVNEIHFQSVIEELKKYE